MRRDDHGVARLQQREPDAAHRRLGIGAGHDVGHYPERLGELSDPLLAIVLDQITGPGALLVAHGAPGLVLDLVELVLEHADSGLVHRQPRQRLGRLGLGELVPHRLTHQVHFVLGPGLVLLERRSGATVELVDVVVGVVGAGRFPLHVR